MVPAVAVRLPLLAVLLACAAPGFSATNTLPVFDRKPATNVAGSNATNARTQSLAEQFLQAVRDKEWGRAADIFEALLAKGPATGLDWATGLECLRQAGRLARIDALLAERVELVTAPGPHQAVLADLAAARGDWDAVFRHVVLWADRSPARQARFVRGAITQILDKAYDAARQTLLSALAGDVVQPALVHQLLAYCSLKLRDVERALDHLQRAWPDAQDSASQAGLLFQLSLRAGAGAAAVRFGSALLALEPALAKSGQFLNNLAMAHVAAWRAEKDPVKKTALAGEAVARAEAAAALLRGWEAFDTASRCHEAHGNLDQAIRYNLLARALRPDDRLLVARGEALAKAKQGGSP